MLYLKFIITINDYRDHRLNFYDRDIFLQFYTIHQN